MREACAGDLEALLPLIAEHAAFERAPAPPVTAAMLADALSGADPRLRVWVAADGSGVVGYLSATRDFSTWRGRPFLHMDCLYLRPGFRGHGHGATLLDALCSHARATGITRLQWQTPAWNADAARFYRRLGARESRKRRFVLDLAAAQD